MELQVEEDWEAQFSKLKDACQNCARPLDPQWRICPYCEAEVGAPPEEPRRRRRSAQATT